MPTPQFPAVGDNAGLPELKDAYIGISRYLTYLLSALDTLNISRLDAKVIVANTITADKMNVDELSAISANLGHITAGLIEAVKIIGSEIYGSYIATAEGTYPRSEMDVEGSFFAALASATNTAKMNPTWLGSSPRLEFDDGFMSASIFTGADVNEALNIVSTKDVLFTLGAFRTVKFPNWFSIYSIADGSTLADELAVLQSQIGSLSSQISSLESRVSALEATAE